MEHLVENAQSGVLRSIFEGIWNGLVVSGVLTVCVLLAKSAAAFFLA